MERMAGESLFAEMVNMLSAEYLHSPYKHMVAIPPTQAVPNYNLEYIGAHPQMLNR